MESESESEFTKDSEKPAKHTIMKVKFLYKNSLLTKKKPTFSQVFKLKNNSQIFH